jgi:hypothetical protein
MFSYKNTTFCDQHPDLDPHDLAKKDKKDKKLDTGTDPH